MIPHASPVTLADVRVSDETYRISTEEGVEALAASLREAGLINPPILLHSAAGHRIVSGFRRVLAALHNGWQRMPCRTLPDTTPRDHCVRIAIADNVSQRPLNWVELARCFALLSSIASERNQLFSLASGLGLPDHPQLVDKMRDVDSLSATVRSALADEVIALPVALELGKSKPEEANAFERMFRRLRPGLNIQREILSLAKEIAARDGITVPRLLMEAEEAAGVGQAPEDRNRWLRDIRRYLRKRRYPTVTETEDRFRQLAASLPLGQGMELGPPKNFEGDRYVLRLQFHSVGELERQQKRLGRIVSSPEIAKLFS